MLLSIIIYVRVMLDSTALQCIVISLLIMIGTPIRLSYQAAEIAAAAAQAQTQALVGVLNRVDELCAHLSYTIRKSVLNLPTSSVMK